jgi:chromosome segregation ATPase
MGEIDSQNVALMEEIAALRAIVDSATPQIENEQGRCEQELLDTRERCSLLEEQIAALRASIELNEAPSGRLNDLFQNEQNLRPEVENENTFNKNSMLEEIAKLKGELQLARAHSTALNEERRQLEVKLSSLGSTEGELVNRLQADLQAKQHEVDSLRSRIKGLQDDGTNAKSEVGLSLGHGEDGRVSVTASAPNALERSQQRPSSA